MIKQVLRPAQAEAAEVVEVEVDHLEVGLEVLQERKVVEVGSVGQARAVEAMARKKVEDPC